jgi:chromosome segregation ATPase
MMRSKYFFVLIAEGGLVVWITTVNWQNVAGTIVILATTMVGGFITIRQMIRADRKKYEIENKDSLIVQIEQLNEKLTRSMEENKARNRQNAALQKQVAELNIQGGQMTDRMNKLSELLIKSTENNTELMTQLSRHQQLTREAGHRTVNQMTGAAAQVQNAVADAVDQVREATVGLKTDIELNRAAVEKVAEATGVPVKPPLPEDENHETA